MIKTRGLYHIHLVVADMERALRFYQSAFGMKELFRDGPHLVFIQTPGGSDLITLNDDPKLAAQAGKGAGVEHFGFQLAEGQSLDDAVTEIEKAGGKILHRSQPHYPRQFVYFTDPDGYTIEL